MNHALLRAAAVAAGVLCPGIALAVPTFVADLTEINGSGVSGKARLTLNGDFLTVHIDATGLEAGQTHPQHIHGLFDTGGNPANSTSPTIAQDTDGDGFVELDEGAATYGPVIVSLLPFPTLSSTTTTIDFTETYDVSGLLGDLLPLDFREIVLHGLTVPAGVGTGTPGEVDGTPGYKTVLPVATGEIRAAIPEPGTLSVLAVGLASIGFTGARRRMRARRT